MDFPGFAYLFSNISEILKKKDSMNLIGNIERFMEVVVYRKRRRKIK